MRNEPEQTWTLWDSPPEPPHQTRDTSVAAYVEHGESGKMSKQQALIVEFLSRHGKPVTRAELAQCVGMRLSSVCGRTNELLKKGRLKDEGRRRCSLTGIMSHEVSLVP